MNQGEFDEKRLKGQFSDFLDENYVTEIQNLKDDYPERLTLVFDWNDLESFDPNLASIYRHNRDAIQSILNEALRFHDAHSAAYLNYVKAIPREVGEVVEARNLNTPRSYITTIIGRISDVGDVEELLEAGVFRYEACEEWTIETRDHVNEVSDPFNCSNCGRRRVSFHLDESRSQVIERVEATLDDTLSITTTGTAAQYDIVVLGESATMIEAGSWYKFTGQSRYTLRENSTIADPHFEAWYAKPTSPLEAFDADDGNLTQKEKVVVEAADVDLSPTYLKGFTTHVEKVIGSIATQQMNETETRTKIITPFLDLLGWDVYGGNVRMEYSTTAGGADYALLDGNDVIGIVEAKSAGSLTHGDFEQIKHYILYTQASYGLLTDGIQYQFVKNSEQRVSPAVVADCRYEHLADFYDVISNFSSEAVLDE